MNEWQVLVWNVGEGLKRFAVFHGLRLMDSGLTGLPFEEAKALAESLLRAHGGEEG